MRRATTSVMITGLDHVAIAVEDFAAASAQYTSLLGTSAHAVSETPGRRAALFTLSNARIVLIEADTRLDGVEGIGLAVADPERALSQLVAAGIKSALLAEHAAAIEPPGIAPAALWALPREATRELTLRLVARASGELPAASSFNVNCIEALDHVVIRTAAPEHGVALYNGALGIRLALDRVLGGVRMLFFRPRGVTLELIEDKSSGGADSFYGLAYRVRDLEAAHQRLTAAGFLLSEPRAGRKPGTHVFSVRSSTCGVPTLIIRDASRD